MCVCVCVCVCVCGGVAAVYFTCLARGGVPLSAQPGSISLTMLRRNFWGRGTDLEPETAKLNVKLNPVLLQGYSIEERLICISRRSFPMGILLSGLFLHCLNIVDLKPIQKLVFWRTNRNSWTCSLLANYVLTDPCLQQRDWLEQIWSEWQSTPFTRIWASGFR